MTDFDINAQMTQKVDTFQVVIRSERGVTPQWVEQAISFYMDDDNNYGQHGSTRIHVSRSGYGTPEEVRDIQTRDAR